MFQVATLKTTLKTFWGNFKKFLFFFFLCVLITQREHNIKIPGNELRGNDFLGGGKRKEKGCCLLRVDIMASVLRDSSRQLPWTPQI